MMPDAPGRAEVGFRTATTVATANDRPAASSSAARTNVDREVTTENPPAQASPGQGGREHSPSEVRGDAPASRRSEDCASERAQRPTRAWAASAGGHALVVQDRPDLLWRDRD